MKKLVFIIGIILVVGVVIVVVNARKLSDLSGSIDQYVEKITQSYSDTIAQNAFDLRDVPDLSDAQRDLLGTIGKLKEELDTDVAIQERLSKIIETQQTLWKFVRADERNNFLLAENPSFVALKEAIGERGEVRKILNVYNDTAKQLNALRRGRTASLTGGGGEQPLPYLRFDGKLEDTRVISF
ncbi:hypothetical protein KJ996_04630 [Patescibacteria group bacterium]|nr:hypothetical protein [Patescibacteria group bacterium]